MIKDELMANGYDAEEADLIISDMKDRVANGDDPEDVLSDEGLGSEFIQELM